jgi:hypothetical protein
LLEAGKALEELPQVKSELDKIKTEAALLRQDNDDAELRVMERDDTIAKLRATLATREAELASATFREAEASAKINNLRAILGAGEPVPVVATEPVGQPQAAASQSESTYIQPPKGPAVYDPSGKAESQWEYDYSHTKVDDSEPGHDKDPTPAPLSGPDSQATTYGVVEGGQFISHDPEPEATIDSQPYSGRPYWQKPSSLTWGEWATKGGLTPTWYDSRYDEFKTA